jgi:hypothetical protein
MAYIASSASNFQDLIDKVKANLVANGWLNLLDSVVSSSRELYFKNSVTDVIIGFKEVSSSPDYFNLLLNSCSSYSGSFDWFNQIGSIPHFPNNTASSGNAMPVLACLNTPMNYWAFIDNDRLILVVKCNTSYNSCYLGKFEQYGSPNQYPKPIFVGGHAKNSTMLNSYTGFENECFIYENAEKKNNCGARLRKYDSTWLSIGNSSLQLDTGFGAIYPTSSLGIENNYTTDGTYDVEPLILYTDTSAAGELKNIFWLAGRGLSAESEITIDSVNYIIFPNIFRTTNKDFYCIKKS